MRGNSQVSELTQPEPERVRGNSQVSELTQPEPERVRGNSQVSELTQSTVHWLCQWNSQQPSVRVDTARARKSAWKQPSVRVDTVNSALAVSMEQSTASEYLHMPSTYFLQCTLAARSRQSDLYERVSASAAERNWRLLSYKERPEALHPHLQLRGHPGLCHHTGWPCILQCLSTYTSHTFYTFPAVRCGGSKQTVSIISIAPQNAVYCGSSKKTLYIISISLHVHVRCGS